MVPLEMSAFVLYDMISEDLSIDYSHPIQLRGTEKMDRSTSPVYPREKYYFILAEQVYLKLVFSVIRGPLDKLFSSL